MRAWVCGLLLASATAGGVVFVFAGAGSPSHCGPCLASPVSATPAAPVGEPVTDVVDLAAALSTPKPVSARESFVSFDEPPLARPADAPMPIPESGIVQATFVDSSNRGPELAPMPRSSWEPGSLPLSSPADPF